MYSYAVKSIVDLNKTEGAYLNALFWVRSLQLLALFSARKVLLIVVHV